MLEDQDFIENFLRKSHSLLLRHRLLAEDLLNQAGINFYDKGYVKVIKNFSGFDNLTSLNYNRNAGLFLWLDLSAHLCIEDTRGDAWATERVLSRRLKMAGVIMSTGEEYHAEEPVRFRLIFCVSEETLREGIRRLVPFILWLRILRKEIRAEQGVVGYALY